MAKVEAHQNCYGFGKRRLYVIAPRDKDDTIITINTGVDLLSTIPIGDFLCAMGKQLQTPNAKAKPTVTPKA